MPEVNKANRQVCDVLINHYKTYKPFLDFTTANVTTIGMSSDNTYAMAKGAKRITFFNPLNGTMGIEAQVYPFKFYSIFSDGTIDSTAMHTDKMTVACTEDGKLTLTPPTKGTIAAGTVFVFPEDSFGDEDSLIEGNFASNIFTATTASEIKKGNKYIVGYAVNLTGVKKISFNNKKTPKDYFITMSTLDKDENGDWTPFKMVVYKATVQRNFELSLSSEGEAATLKATFDLMEDDEGNTLDFIEITEDSDIDSEPDSNTEPDAGQ